MRKVPPVSGSIDFPEETNALRRESQGPNSIEVSIKENGEKDQAEQSQIKNPESEWVIDIQKKLDRAKNDEAPCSFEELCIYRIPHCLRDCNEKAYTPQIVSLGPYHHGKKRLLGMDQNKRRAVNQILKRTNQEITTYLDAIKELEEKIRACYEGPISLSSNDFVEMMVLDSCFILELFRCDDEGFTELGYSWNDPIFALHGYMQLIVRDMLMLENQIPLFVLDRLLGLQSGNPDQKGVVALALEFFDALMPKDEGLSTSDKEKVEDGKKVEWLTRVGGTHCLEVFRKSLLPIPVGENESDKEKVEDGKKVEWLTRVGGTHCLEVFRKSLLPIPVGENEDVQLSEKPRRQQLIRCVMKLKRVGIKFKKRETNILCDIEFKDGVLNIPRLLIHDGTASLFLNLIAYEQCHVDCSNDISLYAFLIDNLIDSAADVSHLHDCGIIENLLGSDAEVADLFNQLSREVVVYLYDTKYSKLSEQINDYHNNRWHTWRATLKSKYFSNPWAIISFIAAVVLLLLTFAQTLYGVYGYYKLPS